MMEVYCRTYTYRETERTETSLLTPKYAAMASPAGDVMLDPRLAANASIPNWKVIQHLYVTDQFRGFSGSSASHFTRFGSSEDWVLSSGSGWFSLLRGIALHSFSRACSMESPEDEVRPDIGIQRLAMRKKKKSTL